MTRRIWTSCRVAATSAEAPPGAAGGLCHPSRDAEKASTTGRRRGRRARSWGRGGRVRPQREPAHREARLRERGVRHRRRARAQAAAEEGEPAPVAHVRLRRRALAHLPLRPPAALPAALVDRRSRLARVPARDRLRARVPGPAEGPLLRAEREDRQGALEEEPPPLRRVLADDRRRPRLPVLHAPGGVPAGPGGRRRVRGRLERPDRPRALAVQVGADRVLAAAARRAPLLRLLGPQRLRRGRADRPADLGLPGATTR